MPHIIVEHTSSIKKNIDLKKLNMDLHTCLSEQETVSLASIKTRSIEVDNAITGDGKHNSFIHINVLLLAGRSEELKTVMADRLYDVAKSHINDEHCLLSVNISHLGTYRK